MNVTQTHESNDPQKNPFAAVAAAVVAASIVAIITLERLNAFTFAVSRCFGLWRIARGHVESEESFAAREKGKCVMCSLSSDFAVYYTILHICV